MDWKPISEAEIKETINESWKQMTSEQQGVWETIKVPPQKCSQEPYGREGNGFLAGQVINPTF